MWGLSLPAADAEQMHKFAEQIFNGMPAPTCLQYIKKANVVHRGILD